MFLVAKGNTPRLGQLNCRFWHQPTLRASAFISSSRAPKALLHITYSFPPWTAAHAFMLLLKIRMHLSPFSSLLYLRLPGWISTLGPSLLIYRQIECDIRKEGHFPSWKPSIKCNCVVKYSFEKGFSGKRISWFHSPKLTWLVLCWNSYDTQTKPKYALVRYRGGP